MKATKELILLKTREYHTENSCFGCVYFKPTKGHFGFCNGALDPKNNSKIKYYDGTKKGTGCSLYRTNIILPENVTVSKDSTFEAMREKHNDHVNKRRFYVKKKKLTAYANYNNYPELQGIFKRPKMSVRDLPYDLTTELARPRRAYSGLHYNRRIIEYAVTRLQVGDDYKTVQNKVEKTFAKKIDSGTISRWNEKFLNFRKHVVISPNKFATIMFLLEQDLLTGDNNAQIPSSCESCKSSQLVKHGIRYNSQTVKQRYRCKQCGYEFIFNDSMKGHKFHPLFIKLATELLDGSISSNDIRKLLQLVFKFKITRHTILAWHKKFRPEVIMPRQRPVSGETKRKISVSCELDSYKKKKEREIAVITN